MTFGKKMKIWAFCTLVTVSCFASQSEESRSPSGRFVVRADVPGRAEESPSFAFRVRLWVEDTATKEKTKLYTGVQGDMWAIVWSPDDALIVYTADREDASRPWVFEFTKDGKMRKPTVAELEIGEKAYVAKYPKRKEPNQSLQPTPPSRRG
jgi:hypothetical protein